MIQTHREDQPICSKVLTECEACSNVGNLWAVDPKIHFGSSTAKVLHYVVLTASWSTSVQFIMFFPDQHLRFSLHLWVHQSSWVIGLATVSPLRGFIIASNGQKGEMEREQIHLFWEDRYFVLITRHRASLVQFALSTRGILSPLWPFQWHEPG